jgi:hypothetical protein
LLKACRSSSTSHMCFHCHSLLSWLSGTDRIAGQGNAENLERALQQLCQLAPQPHSAALTAASVTSFKGPQCMLSIESGLRP